MRYRRAQTKGGTYFFTVVTLKRKNILTHPQNVPLLRQAFQKVRRRRPFKIDAIVLLPDHLHCMWTLPDNDRDFSTRWRLIKSHFTRKCDTQFKLKLFFDSNFQIFEINSRNPLNLLHPNLIWVIPKLKGSAKDIKLYI